MHSNASLFGCISAEIQKRKKDIYSKIANALCHVQTQLTALHRNYDFRSHK